MLELILQGAQRVHHVPRLFTGDVDQIQQLLLDAGGGDAALAADHLHHVIEAAPGGLEGVAGHLGPFLLDAGQQALEAVPELLLQALGLT